MDRGLELCYEPVDVKGAAAFISALKPGFAPHFVAASDSTQNDLDCQTHLLIRGIDAGEDVVRFAADHNVEEIVIGVRRRSKVGKLIFGSTAQYVILNAPCPVVTVR